MVYLATMPGGWIADRLIGPRRAMLYGGIIIAAGHFSMAIPSLATFYLGLFLIVIGTGLLKGNVSVIVGKLYGAADIRRDAGFSIFYMGINLGAFLAPLVCGYLGQQVSWHLGFAAAGFGMLIGVIQYVMGGTNLGDAGIAPAPAPTPEIAAQWKRQVQSWVGGGAALVVVAALAAYFGLLQVSATQVSDAAGVFLLLVVVGFFGWLMFSGGWTPDEKKRLYVITVLFFAASLFWSVFEQAGSTLNLFADRSTRNEAFGMAHPSSWFQSMNSLFIFAFAPVLGVAVGQARVNRQGTDQPDQVCIRLDLRRCRFPDSGDPGPHGRAGRAGQPDVADRHLLPPHHWRTGAQPRRLERDDDPGARPHWRVDDGRVVSGDLGRQLHRRTGVGVLRVVRTADAIRIGRRLRHRRGLHSVGPGAIDAEADEGLRFGAWDLGLET